MRRSSSILGALVSFGLVIAACDSRRPDDPTDPGSDPVDSTVDCPPAHLVIGLANGSGSSSAIARRNALDLSVCRGLSLNGTISAVGGLVDGSELIGIDGEVRRIGLRGEVVWSHESPGYMIEAAGFAVIALGDQYAIAVLWMASYSTSAQEVEILDANTGTQLHLYETVPGSPVGLTGGLDGVSDRIALLDQYASLREAQVVIGAPALGGATDREIAMPRANGELTWAASVGPQLDIGAPGRVAIGSPRGVIYWSTDLAPAGLGPVGCAWPAYAGETIPTACEDYDSAVPIPGVEARFIASCTSRDDSGSRPAIVELGRRGDCRVLTAPSAFGQNVRVVGMAWAGR